MQITNWIDAFNFLGANMALLLALAQLILTNKNQRNYDLAGAFLSLGIFIIISNFHIFKNIDHWYELAYILFILSPFFYFSCMMFLFVFFYTLDLKDFRFKKQYILLGFGPGFVELMLFFISGIPAINYTIAPEDYYNYNYQIIPGKQIGFIMSIMVVVTYVVLIIKKNFRIILLTPRHYRKNILIIILVALVGLFLLSAAFLVRSPFNFNAGKVLLFSTISQLRFTIFIILMFLASFRYPHVLNIIKLEAYRDYYIVTKTKSLNVEKIIDELNTLAADLDFLSDSSLNLKATAARLGITSQQLSEILNTNLNRTFPTWINKKRIKKAKELLVASPEKKVIEIAMETGFNTISVFNVTFKNQTGISPSAYRKKHSS
ncbi:MAG: AraC family transcriptional regulator [Spirochaetes bacterium]|nr:AraC family transcriptional regulator [Spirochaetota bacterium]